MSQSTRSSRLLLGASFLVAITLIVMVASTRPSNSEQAQLLLNNRAVETSPDQTTSEMVSIDDDLELADLPAAGRGIVADSMKIPLQLDQAVKDALPLPAVPTLADQIAALQHESEMATGSQFSPEHRVVAMTDPPDIVALADLAEPSEGPEEVGESSTAPRRDPLKRLSREFARRAAAELGDRADSRSVSPVTQEPFMPIVAMSDEHRKTCHVYLGNTLPDSKLMDREGVEQQLKDAWGKNLTVVVFWNSENPFALDQFQQLETDLVPFNELGVATIAIHVGPLPENYQQLCEKHAADVLCLSDPQKTYFESIATSRLPRTYLLDPEGKILWLDIEYSRTTRHDLKNAILSLLDQ